MLRNSRKIYVFSLLILLVVLLVSGCLKPDKKEIGRSLQKKMQVMGNMAGRWEAAKIIMRDFEPLINAGKFKEAELLIDRALVLIEDKAAEDSIQASIQELAKFGSGILPSIGVAMNTHKNSSSGIRGVVESMDLLTGNGMNLLGFAPTWQQLERAPGEFNLQDELINPLGILVPLYHQLNGVVVTLKMIDTGWRPMPEDIKDKPFDSPEVLRRFDALIDAIAKEPSTKRITHILLGNEIFGYLLLHPEEIPAFVTFYRQGVNRIHQKMPWVKVGTIIGFEGMERMPDAFKKLLDSSDFIAYTYYPQSNIEMVGWQMRPISEVAGHLHFMAEHAQGKPFAFTEIGYSSSPINGSSEEKQAEFIDEMFRILEPYWKNGQIAFLLYHLMYDYPPSFTDPYAKEQGIEPSKEFRAFVENLGLRSYETGKPRKGWDTFVQGVENWIPKTSFVEDMEGEEIQSPSKSLKEKKQRLELLAERWHSVEKVMQDFEPLLKSGKYKEAEELIDQALVLLQQKESRIDSLENLRRAKLLYEKLNSQYDIADVAKRLQDAERQINSGGNPEAEGFLKQLLSQLEDIEQGRPCELLCHSLGHQLEPLARIHEALGRNLSEFKLAADKIPPFLNSKNWIAAWQAIQEAAEKLNALNSPDRNNPDKINTNGFEAEPTITSDGKVLYFQYSPRYLFKPNTPRQGPDREGLSFKDTGLDNNAIGVRTFRSVWDGQKWSVPEVQIFPNEGRQTKEPLFGCVIIGIAPSDNAASLIIYRKREGTPGDIAISERTSEKQWGAFKFLDEINTDFTDEDAHFDLVPGQNRLYFLSDRPLGYGGGDIYYAEKNKIFHLDEPINTSAGEWFPQPDAFGNIYFTRGNIRVATSSGDERPCEFAGRPDLPAMAPAITKNGALLFYRMPVRALAVASDADSDIFFSVRAGIEPWQWSEPIPVDLRKSEDEPKGLLFSAQYALKQSRMFLETHQNFSEAKRLEEIINQAQGLLSENKASEAFETAFNGWNIIISQAAEEVLLQGHPLAASLPKEAGRLLPPEYGVYIGTWSQDGTPDLKSLSEFQRLGNLRVRIDHIDLSMQRMDGNLQPLDEPFKLTASGPEVGLPPLTLMKLRAQAGIVTALQLHVPDGNTDYAFQRAWKDAPDDLRKKYGLKETIPPEKRVWMQDILDGKYDDYFIEAARKLKEFGQPVMLEFLNEFDVDFYDKGFGEDGKTHRLDLLNGAGFFKKLQEFHQKNKRLPRDPLEIGLTQPLRSDGPELYTAYGDPKVLDAPERVRDTWRHVHDLFDEIGCANITWYNHTAGGRKDKYKSGEQPLSAYWPGENYVDWAGSSSYCRDTAADRNSQNTPGTLGWVILPWYEETRSSEWKSRPLIMHELSQIFPEKAWPFQGKDNLAKWLEAIFAKKLPEDLPRIKAFFLIYNNFGPMESWSRDEIEAVRKYIARNPYYAAQLQFNPDHTPPARITDLKADTVEGGIKLSWTSVGDDQNTGTVARYIIKYRTQRFSSSGGVEKDFLKEPWRLWSAQDTFEISNPPKPALGATKQEMIIESLKPGIYWFAIQSVDDVGYNSKISNVIEAVVPERR